MIQCLNYDAMLECLLVFFLFDLCYFSTVGFNSCSPVFFRLHIMHLHFSCFLKNDTVFEITTWSKDHLKLLSGKLVTAYMNKS